MYCSTHQNKAMGNTMAEKKDQLLRQIENQQKFSWPAYED
jgi:hypothetical protein